MTLALLLWLQTATGGFSTVEVRVERNLAYVENAEPKQKLNLFLPKTEKPFPVVMWIHGGGWAVGDRAWFSALGRRFAERGVGLAAISYRLTPAVKHPEHIKDCARAFAWLHAHIKEYGGDPDRLFVCGQSAGGHLSALLALDRKYLDDLKVPADAIKGVIPMSGVYEIKNQKFFTDIFGDDAGVLKDASPIEHAKEAKAPMLVLTETVDTFNLRPDMEKFKKALEDAGFKDATFKDADGRDHITIVLGMLKPGDDPVRDAIIDFVKKRCADLDK